MAWTAIDDSRARATVSGTGTTISLEFRFDADGRNVSIFAPDRFYDDGKATPTAEPWEARHLQFGEHNGLMVATESVAEWHLPSRTFQCWRGRPTHIDYRHGSVTPRVVH